MELFDQLIKQPLQELNISYNSFVKKEVDNTLFGNIIIPDITDENSIRDLIKNNMNTYNNSHQDQVMIHLYHRFFPEECGQKWVGFMLTHVTNEGDKP